MLRKIFKSGNSRVIAVPSDFEVGEYVDVEISRVEIRKVNKSAPSESDSMHRELNQDRQVPNFLEGLSACCSY